MAFVYILYSEKLNKHYIGSCLNLENRLQEHQQKLIEGSFTSKTSDWILFYKMDDLTFHQARAIEKHIKQMKSKAYIENLKKYSDLSQKLRVRFIDLSE